MEKPCLLVLAAGMGSRYGGLKQIDPLGPNGEIIIDYSLYDARLAGFEKVVFVIKEELQDIFEEKIGRLARKTMQVEYAFQSVDDVPSGAEIPQGRTKPWGTAQAVLCAKSKIDGPFGVINADDFYGRQTYKLLYDFLAAEHPAGVQEFCMVGFVLKNTLTENGDVSRGVCVEENGFLKSVTEHTNIRKTADGAQFTKDGKTFVALDGDCTVSMNVWGFQKSIFAELETKFADFLKGTHENPLKAECYLPSCVSELTEEKMATVEVLKSGEEWFGVTYPEDKASVMAALEHAHEMNIYPALR